MVCATKWLDGCVQEGRHIDLVMKMQGALSFATASEPEKHHLQHCTSLELASALPVINPRRIHTCTPINTTGATLLENKIHF